MKKAMTAALILLALSTAQAQLRKCTGPDGKVTYSDVLCGNKTVGESRVNTNANTLDYSGMRKAAGQMEAAQEQNRANERADQLDNEIANLMANPPIQCRYKYHSLGDEKGKALAIAARKECIMNIRASKLGQPQSKTDYALWNDHFNQTAVSRQNGIANAQANNRAIQKSMEGIGREAPKTNFTCRKNIMGDGFDCK